MRKYGCVLMLVAATGLVTALPLLARPKKINDTIAPAFASEKYTFRCTELSASTKADFTKTEPIKHTLTLEGTLAPPSGVDCVCAREALALKQIVDKEGNNLLLPQKQKTKAKRNLDYNSVRNSRAAVELDKILLRKAPHAIHKLVVETVVVIASKREEITLPAVVMEDYRKNVVKGLSLRVVSLKISEERDMTVKVAYRRKRGGPFIESAAIITKDEEEIGTSRWTKGTPFGETGEFTFEIALRGKQEHQSIRLTFVTKWEMKPLSFEVTKIFQR